MPKISRKGTWCVACRKTIHGGGTFHYFPTKDKDRLQRWVSALPRDHFKPTIYSRMCGKHFLLSDYLPNSRHLKKTAVPSVFDSSEDDYNFRKYGVSLKTMHLNVSPVDYGPPLESNNNLFVPNMPLRFFQPEYPPPAQVDLTLPETKYEPKYPSGSGSPSCKQKVSSQQIQQQAQPLQASYQSKYSELLNVIEDLGREIKPTYAGSKMAQERLKKGIMHARDLVRECLAEVEKSSRE